MIQFRRLLKLADLLEADAKNKDGIRFNFSVWGIVDYEAPVSCDTQACAMGLAALSGAFKRQGLSYRIVGDWYNPQSFVFTMDGRAVHGLKAARRIFGISSSDASDLFVTPVDTPTQLGARAERAVAKRIRQFVKEKQSNART